MTLFRHYANPLRDVRNLRAMRIDQGVDYAGSGPIYAAGRAVLVQYDQHNSGWPGGGFVAYRFTTGPASGKTVYLAENLALNRNLKVGDRVGRHTPIAWLRDAYPNCETGWASPGGTRPLAQLFGGYHEGQLTALGANFDKFMVHLGAPAGLTQGRPVSGSLPPIWPTKWTFRHF